MDHFMAAFGFENEYFEPGEAQYARWSGRRAKKPDSSVAIEVLKRYKRKLSSHRRLRSLELLLTVPIDILCEIFSYMHPLDLYHLCAATQQFSAILGDSHFRSVWILAFKRFEDIPTPPDDFPFPKEWASLIFGSSGCQECGTRPAHSDLTFRVRLCLTCRKERFVTQEDMRAKYGKMASEWCNLIGWSELIIADSFNTEETEYDDYCSYCYPKADIDQIVPKASALQEAARNDGSDASKAAKREYWDQTSEAARLQVSRARQGHRWALGIHEDITWKARDNVKLVISNLKHKLVRFGYDCKDMEHVDLHKISDTLLSIVAPRGLRRFSNSRARRLLHLIEPLIEEGHQKRLEAEREATLEKRLQVLRPIYRQYRIDNHPPATWPYLPPLYVIRAIPDVYRLVDAEGNGDMDAGILEEVVKNSLHPFVTNWLLEKKRELLRQLPSYSESSQQDLPTPSTSEAKGKGREEDFSALDLATSVFSCLGSVKYNRAGGRSLIGYAGAMPHYHCPALKKFWERRLHFNRTGYDCATFLVNFVGLDPASTTVKEMDEACVERRFICESCPPTTYDDQPARVVYSWREAVYHFIVQNHSSPESHPTPAWTLMAQDRLPWVLEHDRTTFYFEQDAWFCGHCPEHLDNWQTRESVTAHLEERHSIVGRPVVGVDIFENVYRHFRLKGPVELPDNPV